jgi:hypothetical protein
VRPIASHPAFNPFGAAGASSRSVEGVPYAFRLIVISPLTSNCDVSSGRSSDRRMNLPGKMRSSPGFAGGITVPRRTRSRFRLHRCDRSRARARNGQGRRTSFITPTVRAATRAPPSRTTKTIVPVPQPPSWWPPIIPDLPE